MNIFAERTAQLQTLNHSLADDIQKRQQLEKVLLYQAQILDLANDAIFARDLDDHITYWNQGARLMYGWTKEEFIGRFCHDVLKTEFPQSLDTIRKQLMSEEHWEGELLHTRRDGSTLTTASRWTLQKDDDGTPTRIIEMNFDISERKDMERALREKTSTSSVPQKLKTVSCQYVP